MVTSKCDKCTVSKVDSNFRDVLPKKLQNKTFHMFVK